MAAAETRLRVVDTAIRMIDERGLAAVSTNKVATGAGVSWGVLQYHFGSRKSLLRACLQRCLEQQLERLETPTAGAAVADIVAAEARFLFSLFDCAAHRVASTLIAQDPELATSVQELLLRYRGLQQARWRQGLQSALPSVPAKQLEELRLLLGHTLSGLAQQRRLGVLVLADRQVLLGARAVTALLCEADAGGSVNQSAARTLAV